MQAHAAALHALQADAEAALGGLAAEAVAVARAEQGETLKKKTKKRKQKKLVTLL
jgi:hypothetical protein